MRVHQNIVINGKDYGDRPSRKDSKFCNEGKWDNFIAPLLPKDCTEMALVEYGSNAGMYLRLAKERGFDRVVGVEQQKKACDMAIGYRDGLGLDYKIINQVVDDNFDFSQLPVADVSLLANFHYHQRIQDLDHLMKNLRFKTRYCLIVSISTPAKVPWRPEPRVTDVRSYFRYWKEVGYIPPISDEGDPHPREGMYGIMFESVLSRMPIDRITKQGGTPIEFGNAVCEFVTHCMKDKDYDYLASRYTRNILRQKHNKQPEEVTLAYMKDLKEHMWSIGQDGIKDPIIINRHNDLLDGRHRLIATKLMGHTSIIVRQL